MHNHYDTIRYAGASNTNFKLIVDALNTQMWLGVKE